jgi:hypothetical protein
LSGPAILQISNYWIPGQEISIDLLPDRNITDELLEEKKLHNTSLLRNYLAPYLSKSLASKLQDLLWEDIAEIPVSNISKKKLVHIGSMLKRWVIRPSSTEGYRTAEVTKGGIDTDFINPQTMEVKDQRGLYFVGEVLDVTGHLGGFNFQWAWSSGYCAGLDA